MAVEVSRQAENKIVYKLTLVAQERCQWLIDEFTECAKGRTVTLPFACRDKYAKSQDCIHLYVNDKNIEAVKQRWVEGGRERHPDWAALMQGLLPPGPPPPPAQPPPESSSK